MNNKLLNEYLKIILSYVIIMSEYETISASNINYAIYKIDDWKNEYKINILGTSRELPLTQVTKKHMLKNMEQIRLSEFELPGKVINGMLALAMQLNPEIAKEDIDELIKLEEKEFKMISEELDSLEYIDSSEFISLDSEEYVIYKLEYDGHMLVSKPANEFTEKHHMEEIKRLKELQGN